jgi:hypothetical protein
MANAANVQAQPGRLHTEAAAAAVVMQQQLQSNCSCISTVAADVAANLVDVGIDTAGQAVGATRHVSGKLSTGLHLLQ